MDPVIDGGMDPKMLVAEAPVPPHLGCQAAPPSPVWDSRDGLGAEPWSCRAGAPG